MTVTASCKADAAYTRVVVLLLLFLLLLRMLISLGVHQYRFKYRHKHGDTDRQAVVERLCNTQILRETEMRCKGI